MDVDAFTSFLRTAELPPGLFATDVFCDLNVPEWRFQLQGAEAFAAWAKGEAPDGSTVTTGRVENADRTAVVETEMVSGGSYSRNLWVLRADDTGLVDEVVLYCTGPWDAATIERQAREAPMIRR